MSKFERVMQQMSEMSGEEAARTTEARKVSCICPTCPTYNDCANGRNELLYCVLGKSPECISEEVDCVCPGCPVTDEMGLEHTFFCTRGSEKEQRKL